MYRAHPRIYKIQQSAGICAQAAARDLLKRSSISYKSKGKSKGAQAVRARSNLRMRTLHQCRRNERKVQGSSQSPQLAQELMQTQKAQHFMGRMRLWTQGGSMQTKSVRGWAALRQAAAHPTLTQNTKYRVQGSGGLPGLLRKTLPAPGHKGLPSPLLPWH